MINNSSELTPNDASLEISIDSLESSANNPSDPAIQAVPLDGLLLQLSEEQQKELVAIVKEDYRNAIQAREKRDWGKQAGGDGEGLTVDEKFAELIDLYEGADQKRPEQWMCARSLKIA